MTLRPAAASKFHAISGAVMLAAVTAWIPALQAGNTWDGGGGNALWSTGANWSPDGAPGYGTLNFAGNVITHNTNDSITAMNQVQWTGVTTTGWIMNNSGGTILSLFDNGGVQAKLENLAASTLVAINAPITFAATTGANFGEINAVNGNFNFFGGTLTVNGSAVNGIKLFGGAGRDVRFASTVSASGKYFAFTNTNGSSVTIATGGSVTTGDFYVMNGGTLNLSGGTLTTSAVRLGGDFGTTGNQNQTFGGTLALTPAAGGVSFSSPINAVSGNTSNALLIDSQNTSGTNTLTSGVFLDSDLTIQQSAGGALSTSTGVFDMKNRKLTVDSDGTVTIGQALSSTLGAGGFLVKQGSGTLNLSGTSNTYTGLNNATLNANGTQIAEGTLGISGDGSLGLAPAGAYNNIQFTTISGGTLKALASNISLHANRNISIAAAAQASFDSNGNTFTINGVINGATGYVNIAGTGGTVILTGNNTYGGNTLVSQGTLQVNVNNALGTAGGNFTTVLNGAALKLNNVNYSTAESLEINGAGVGLGSGALVNAGTSTYSGQVSAGSNATIHTGGGILNLTGGIVKDGVTLTLTGGGTVNVTGTGISGANANSDLVVDGTTLVLSAASSYNGPTSVQNGGTLVLGSSAVLPSAPHTALTLTGSSFFDLNGESDIIASLNGSVSQVTNGLAASGSTLTVGGSNGSGSFSGVISDGAGLVTIIKTGSGTQTLSGASTYSDGTTVQDGVLNITNASGSGTGSGNVQIDTNGTLAGTGRIVAAMDNFINIDGALVVGDDTLGSPVASVFHLQTSGTGSTVLGVGSALTFDLFTGAGAGDNTGLAVAADYIRLFGLLDSTLGGTLVLNNPNGMSGWAAGDMWKLFDLTGPGAITTNLAIDDTSLGLGGGLVGNFDILTGNYYITAVPEPSRMMLIGLALLGLSFRRRR